jgi:hypothetical protein
MTDVLYPDAYGTGMLTLAQVKAKHGPHLHPEAARRLWALLEAYPGKFGVGGGYRPPGTQPNASGFAAPGRSFHEGQTFRSGITAYSAWDLVVVNPGGRHRAPTWAEGELLVPFGLHTFIGRKTTTTYDDESWHAQPIEIRGYTSWVDAGRPDPDPNFVLPAPPAVEPVPPEPVPSQYPFEDNYYGLYPFNVNKPKVSRPLGSTGEFVRYLQAVLRFEAGQQITIDGQFGLATETAVLNLQRFCNLVVDGWVGPKTWEVIDLLAKRV